MEFGSAPVLIRSTRKAGKIKVKARVQYEGTHAPTPAEIEFESVPSLLPACFTEQTRQTDAASIDKERAASSEKKILSEEEKQNYL